ncbi:hypothetical protein J4214_02535 [Candidatus Woesearchaeota archaeon]|nr:hypothetical protein [Candidatus Woesearchaeota archaeon]
MEITKKTTIKELLDASGDIYNPTIESLDEGRVYTTNLRQYENHPEFEGCTVEIIATKYCGLKRYRVFSRESETRFSLSCFKT